MSPTRRVRTRQAESSQVREMLLSRLAWVLVCLFGFAATACGSGSPDRPDSLGTVQQAALKTNGAACILGSECLSGSCFITCNGSTCSSAGITSCDDANVCTTDTCSTTAGCGHTAAASGTVCRAAINACDITETCGGATSCPSDTVVAAGTTCTDDGSFQTMDYCNGTSGSPACTHPTCTAGTLNCDGNNTCEKTNTDASCGCSNTACTTSQTCNTTTGACTACSAGSLDCDTSAANGCEKLTNSDLSCGTTCTNTTACTSSQTCSAGSCIACGTGLMDCDITASNGCEKTINSDTSCGTTCTTTSCTTSQTCSSGSCTGCAAGTMDCNGSAADGCEKNTNTDASNCGGCGTVCVTGTGTTANVCSSGVCTPTCAANYASCDGNGTNGCETYLNSNSTCGTSCTNTVACSGSQTCTNGVCLSSGGQQCRINSDCASGFCVDGYCCNTACSGACDVCNYPGSVGTCTSDDAMCGSAQYCVSGSCVSRSSNGTGCSSDSQCLSENCSGTCGNCTYGLLGSTGNCDDGKQCTTDTGCSSGLLGSGCTYSNVGSGVPCGNSASTCQILGCNGSGSCTTQNKASGTPCSTGNLCILNEVCNGSGACGGGSTLNCDDGNPCTTDACASGGTCTHTNVAAGTLCRGRVDICDAPEFCDGSGNCGANAYAAVNTDCAYPGSGATAATIIWNGGALTNTLDFNSAAGDWTSQSVTLVASGSVPGYWASDAAKWLSTSSSTAVANRYTYWQFASTAYTIVAGDYLEYDVYLAPTAYGGTGGLDVLDSTTYWRDTGYVDQNNLGGHPASDLTSKANGTWYHRRLPAPHAGSTTSKWDIVTELDTASTTSTVYFDNVKITKKRGGCSSAGTCLLHTGEACTANSDCGTGFCVDGVCCDGSCGGGSTTDCQVCNGTGTVGTCTAVAAGSVCGSDLCAGPGTCGSGASAGTCVPGTPVTCAPVTECQASVSCDPATGNCIYTNKADGTACSTDSNPCSLDQCVTGVCNHATATGLGVTCRAAVLGPDGTTCDKAETCDGISTACPADGLLASNTVCRNKVTAGDGTSCDVAEVCTGLSATCPTDSFVAGGTQCRGAANECDLAETCTGSTAACPSDLVKVAGSACTDDLQVCTTDLCNGTVGAPACVHVAGNAGTTCRAAVGTCDVAETCSGTSTSCPADTLAPAGTSCRSAVNECDVAESCTGSSGTCPTDAVKTAGAACSDDGIVCTADVCNGNLTTPACTHPAGNAGTVCRASAGVCDVAESCDGTSTSCPADGFVTAGTSCRAATNECDLAESCTGSSGACPPDTVKAAGAACTDDGLLCSTDLCNGTVGSPACVHAAGNAGTVCRASAGVCDVAETCSGSSTGCPADGFVTAGTACRAATNECDLVEACTGSSALCPADSVKPAGTACTDDGVICSTDLCNGTAGSPACVHAAGNAGVTCRTAAGPCDLAETCTGGSTSCPPDAKSTAICRPSAGVCDLADSCDGVSDSCPLDAKSTAVCRASAGVCDLADSCDGVTNNCPGDAKSTAVCRPAVGVCDLADSCDGLNDNCPADLKSTAVCRVAAGVCDLADSCDGLNNNCPADLKSTAVCRPSVGVCDLADSCDGVTNNCPADLKSTAVCRPAGNQCDAAESCSGTSDTCPADGWLADGTACDDGQVCTTPDSCLSGVCQGTPSLAGCDDGKSCTVEGCSGGTCTHTYVNSACDDGNPCTIDTCNPAAGGSDPTTGCTHTAAPATTVCRAAANECDVAESCDGTSTTCPSDTVKAAGTACTDDGNICTTDSCNGTSGAPACAHPAGNAGTVCRSSVGVCDLAETCDGASTLCPADSKSTAICRASAGACDLPESCDGVTDNCPGDVKSTAVCRAAAGACDLPESCDGVSNSCPADLKGTGVCRPSLGVCDVAESCDGLNNNCPSDTKSTAVCRPSAGVCDVADSCDGVNNNCPTDAKSSSVCRPSAGPCDVADLCDGVNNACPTDAKSTAVCRPAAGVCDVADSCDGVTNACPTDLKSTAVCRPSVGVCDVPDSCDGLNNNCPTDAKSTAVCRAAAGVCDVADSCDGVTDTCPADLKSTAVCRPSVGVCDLADSCDGVGDACPADQKSTALCRASAGVCDVPDYCDGANNACPTDAKSSLVCRPVAGPCDVSETCDGTSNNCPADAFVTAGTVCRGVADVCDVSESCTGGSAACPADTFQPSTVTCRPSVGDCDIVDNCTGASAACPPDAVDAAGTACPDDGQFCSADACNGTSGFCQHTPTNGGVVCRAAVDVCDIAETCPGTPTGPGDYMQTVTLTNPGGVLTNFQAEIVIDATNTAFWSHLAGGGSPTGNDIRIQESGTDLGYFIETLDKTNSIAKFVATLPTVGANVSYTLNLYYGNGLLPAVAGSVQPIVPVTPAPTIVVNNDETYVPNSSLAIYCPPDGLEPVTYVCRAAADVCDRVETCTGFSVSCPPDTIEPAGAVCIDDGKACTTDLCDGTISGCVHTEVPAGTEMPGCGLFVCGATDCLTQCFSDADCVSTAYCNGVGGVCVPRLPNGNTCDRDRVCTSSNCIDGTCCNTTCGDQCAACNLPGLEGTCSPVLGNPVGARTPCAVDGTICGNQACNGTDMLSCHYPSNSTPCGITYCSNGVESDAATCNGSGSCGTPTTKNCAPYACGTTLCLTSCSTDADCSTGNYCSGGACIPKQTTGTPCTTNNQCVTGYCAAGVCTPCTLDAQCGASATCNTGTGNCAPCQTTSGTPLGTAQSMPAPLPSPAYVDWGTGWLPYSNDLCVLQNNADGTWTRANCSEIHPGVCEGPQLQVSGTALNGAYTDWTSPTGPPASGGGDLRARMTMDGSWDLSSSSATYESVCAGPVKVAVLPPSGMTEVTDASACTGANNEFYYDNNSAPTTLVLCPSACSAVQQDPRGLLTIDLGCLNTMNPPIPPATGPSPQKTTLYSEDYVATCGTQQGPMWQYLSYDTSAPPDSSIVWDAQTAATQADLATATWVNLTTVTRAAANEICGPALACGPVDLFSALGVGARLPYLRLRMTLNADLTKGGLPQINNWHVSHTCQDNR